MPHVTPLSFWERKNLLQTHNYFRSLFANNNTNMKLMEWDCELEKIAESFINSCARNKRRKSNDNLGSNIFNGKPGLVQVWTLMDQQRIYNEVDGTCKNGENCWTWKQIVWAESYRLGCAAVSPDCPHQYNVCLYSPGLETGPAYKTGGDVCSDCSGEWTFCVFNLCSKSRVPPTLPVPDNCEDVQGMSPSGAVVSPSLAWLGFLSCVPPVLGLALLF